MKCWNCGYELGELEKAFHNDECPKCFSDIKCCRMCVFYDPIKYRGCQETEAEFVQEKDKRNYCGYFKLNTDISVEKKSSKEDAQKKWDELFGKLNSK